MLLDQATNMTNIMAAKSSKFFTPLLLLKLKLAAT